ncbi:hypothetical protein ACGFJT_26980 [Actinomadura geliboluensis]|uniref:hypothetical protein n=1 Tax=Actinomadura geliboluensis TaxID=882440 RepID=UPI0037152551
MLNARLLPRLLRLPDGHPDGPVHTRGPLSSRTANPSPPAAPPRAHLPHTGRPRLSYDRLHVLMDTHFGEQKVPLQLITAKTRHKNPRSAMRYTRPGNEAVAEITGILALRRTR